MAGARDNPDRGTVVNGDFLEWTERLLARMKSERGWSQKRVAAAGGISESQIKRWRAIGGPQSLPSARKLATFCQRLGVGTDEPFGYLGYLGWQPGADDAPPDDLTMWSERVRTLLRDPNISADERERYLNVLEMAWNDYERRAAERDESEASESGSGDGSEDIAREAG